MESPAGDSENDSSSKEDLGADADSASPSSPAPRRRFALDQLLSGRPQPASGRPARDRPTTTREIVNGLDERERRLAAAGVLLATGFVIAGYLINRHSHVTKVRTASTTLLIAGLIIIVIMLIGVFFRRRALVGFSSFMVGFELITGGVVEGIVFLGFGGWLLVRALRRQRQDQSARRPLAATASAPPPPSGPPKPSKRYTPPRQSRAGSRRR